jgi:hypothetical protein
LVSSSTKRMRALILIETIYCVKLQRKKEKVIVKETK